MITQAKIRISCRYNVQWVQLGDVLAVIQWTHKNTYLCANYDDQREEGDVILTSSVIDVEKLLISTAMFCRNSPVRRSTRPDR